jgi:hypothetical protein
MNAYHNIETRKHNGYRVGYAKSTGQTLRIYGDSRTGWRVNCHWCRTLADVSAYLSSL